MHSYMASNCCGTHNNGKHPKHVKRVRKGQKPPSHHRQHTTSGFGAVQIGHKVGIITTGVQECNIITAVKAFEDNPYDDHIIEPSLAQMKTYRLALPREIIYERGAFFLIFFLNLA
jgi:hypothetical protein